MSVKGYWNCCGYRISIINKEVLKRCPNCKRLPNKSEVKKAIKNKEEKKNYKFCKMVEKEI